MHVYKHHKIFNSVEIKLLPTKIHAHNRSLMSQIEHIYEKENREDGRKQLDSDTKIKVAMINAEARLIDADDNNDGYVDNVTFFRLRKQGKKAGDRANCSYYIKSLLKPKILN